MSHRFRAIAIDDDPLFRSLIASILRHDFQVSSAKSGEEGFYQALDLPPDVAIIDIQMPGWDGFRTMRAFRSHPALVAVKIVILTSDSSRETLLAAEQEGADEYIIKTNFSKQEFAAKLTNLLRADRPPQSDDGFELGPEQLDVDDDPAKSLCTNSVYSTGESIRSSMAASSETEFSLDALRSQPY